MTDEPTYTLSGFGDEIAPDLATQLEVLSDAGLTHVDVRNVDETNVLDFSPEQVAAVQDTLAEYGFSVSSIGSPIGKVQITDDFEPHLADFRTAVERAKQFDARYVRIFSYYYPEGDDPAEWRDEVMARMERKAEIAEAEDVILVHENEKDIYGDTAARCRDIIETVDSPNLKAAFDPANFVEVGETPYPDALLELVEHVEYLHIKDATTEGEITPAGEGDGGIPEILDVLARRGFTGYTSLEPHLSQAGQFSGYSGPENFTRAIEVLKAVMDDVGVTYDA
ncbi:MAG: sugar phosphate isomerase/epimerase family protein [Halobacteriaceae archaeon]